MISTERRNNPMKKFVKTLAATLATVLVLGMTVSAAGSTSTSTTDSADKANVENTQAMAKSGQTKAVDANGEVVALTFGFGVDMQSAQDFATAHGLGTVLAQFDMSAAKSNVTVTLKIPGLKNDTAYTALHKKGDSWEQLATTNNNNGTVSFHVNDCSPFAIVEGTASAAVVAPKTGEVIALAAIMAIVMMAGAAVCAKKARIQK